MDGPTAPGVLGKRNATQPVPSSQPTRRRASSYAGYSPQGDPERSTTADPDIQWLPTLLPAQAGPGAQHGHSRLPASIPAAPCPVCGCDLARVSDTETGRAAHVHACIDRQLSCAAPGPSARLSTPAAAQRPSAPLPMPANGPCGREPGPGATAVPGYVNQPAMRSSAAAQTTTAHVGRPPGGWSGPGATVGHVGHVGRQPSGFAECGRGGHSTGGWQGCRADGLAVLESGERAAPVVLCDDEAAAEEAEEAAGEQECWGEEPGWQAQEAWDSRHDAGEASWGGEELLEGGEAGEAGSERWQQHEDEKEQDILTAGHGVEAESPLEADDDDETDPVAHWWVPGSGLQPSCWGPPLGTRARGHGMRGGLRKASPLTAALRLPHPQLPRAACTSLTVRPSHLSHTRITLHTCGTLAVLPTPRPPGWRRTGYRAGCRASATLRWTPAPPRSFATPTCR
jgi:hypothetical protein